LRQDNVVKAKETFDLLPPIDSQLYKLIKTKISNEMSAYEQSTKAMKHDQDRSTSD